MSFENVHSAIFMVYRAFGLVPFQFHFKSITKSQRNPSKKWKKHVYLISELLWFICLLLLELYWLIESAMACYGHSIRLSFDIYNTFHFSVAFSARVLLIVITIESYCKRNVQVKIMNDLYEIDRIFADKLKLKMNYYRLRRQIGMAFLSAIFIYIVTLFLLIFLYWNDAYDQFLIPFTVYTFFKRALSGSCHITYALFVKYRIEAMHEVLDSNLILAQQNSIEICIDRQRCNDMEAFELRRMVYLWEIFSKIYDIVQLINCRFKWSISVNFPINTFDISVAVFAALNRIVKPANPSIVVYASFSWALVVLLSTFSMGSIIQAANCLSKEADKLAQNLHRIRSCDIDSDELQDLVRQAFFSNSF